MPLHSPRFMQHPLLLSRIWLCLLTAGALSGCGGATGGTDPNTSTPLTAQLSINLADAGTPSNRGLLGNNIEWTNEGDGLVTTAGVQRPAVVNAVNALGTSVLRYPGGSLTDTYHWTDGVGPVTGRGFNRDLANNMQQVIFGTNEFLQLAATLSATPLLTVNVITANAQEAANWVAYANTGGQRVKYWEIGNEPYLKEDNRPDLAITPAQFAQRADLAITAMKAVDPSIKVGLPLRSDTIGNTPATPYPGYNHTVLQGVTNHIDFVSVHNAYLPFTYTNAAVSDQDLYTAAMAASRVMAADLDATAAQVRAQRVEGVLPMALTEYNALFGLSTPALIQKSSSLAGALYVADMLGVLAQRNDILFANFWSLSGNGSFGAVDTSGNPRPAYYVLQSYSHLLQGQVLPVAISAPSFANPAVGVVPAGNSPVVSAVATRLNKTLRIAVINKHASSALSFSIDLAHGQAAGGSTYSSLSGAELFSGAPGYAAVSWTTGTVAGSGAHMALTVPAHSFTLLDIPLL